MTGADETGAAAPRVLARLVDVSVELGHRRVLTGVSLELHDGEVTALLGPNGAGKSTLLSTIAGLIRPSAGSRELSGSIATALQNPGLARRSGLANVMLALAWSRVPYRQRRARADRALSDLRASHLAGRRATLLSGGEQRRIHLARAFALDPDILLLDEPFAGLDAETRGALLEDAASVLQSRRGATLVVAHDRAEAWALATRILVLMDGEIVADGTPRELLEAPPSARVARFLGYDGEVVRGGQVLLTRAANVRVVSGGADAGAGGADGVDGMGPAGGAGEAGSVRRITPLEDGARVGIEVAGGTVFAVVSGELPALGDVVRVRIDGGALFPLEDESPTSR